MIVCLVIFHFTFHTTLPKDFVLSLLQTTTNRSTTFPAAVSHRSYSSRTSFHQ